MLSLKMVKGMELADGVVPEVSLPAPPAGRQTFTIGRDPANQWAIPDRTLAISARHCEIAFDDGGAAVLRDLSTNGTFVNGAAARLGGTHALRDGDRIELGPYTIVVQASDRAVAGLPVRNLAAQPALAEPGFKPPAPSVGSTAPLRGGDPAAMLAHAGARQLGLTEILRHAPPAEDSPLALTKIRPAPRRAPDNAARAASPLASRPPPAVASVSASAPAAPPTTGKEVQRSPAPTASDPLLTQLATGLGLPPEALAGRDAAQVAAQIGAVARAAVAALRQLLEQQSLGRRRIGSRAPALVPMRDVHPLRLAASSEAALLSLLAPGADVQAPLRRAASELAAHHDRLMAAFGGAAAALGAEMAPAALQAALPAETDEAEAAHHARLWALYTGLWQGIGLAPGQPWPDGFVEAASLHLAAAYDAHGRP